MNTNREKLEVDLTDYSATAKSNLARKAKRWKLRQACLGFGAATSAALVGGTWLDADIIYSGVQNIVINAGTGIVNTSIDIDGGGDDFKFEIKAGGAYAIISGVFQAGFGTGEAALSAEPFRPAQKFSSGQMIGTAGSNLGEPNPGGGIDPLQWENAFLYEGINGWAQPGFTSTPGFVGVQLTSGNFAWIRVQVDTAAQLVDKVTIIDWAYDDMGQHLLAGAGASTGDGAVVPEPTSAMLFMTLGLMSMGAAGVREHRRRKREAAKATE